MDGRVKVAARQGRKAKLAGPPAPDEPSTRSRILEASRMLFNRDGVQGTAMFRIASELSMSPGNLTYHFRSKSDIVRVLADELELRIAAVLNGLATPVRPPEVVACMEDILRTMWASRFFFNSALFVSRMDDDLAARFRQVHGTLCSVIKGYLEKLIARREMRMPRHAGGVGLLSDNIVAVWLQWLRLESIGAPEAGDAGTAALGRCLRHHFGLMDPYMSRRFADAIWQEADARFGD